jgi:Xaa-Pro aminopeptidase
MKRLTLWMIALAALLAGTLCAQDITGTWQGSVGDLRIVIKISPADNQHLTAVLYSIDQGGQPITASAITQQAATIKITVASIKVVYEGKLSTDGNSLAGTETYHGVPFPLNLARATPATAWQFPHQVDLAPSEFKARRAELAKRFPDGIVLLHARADSFPWDSFAFREDPSFYYFFGGGGYINSILAIDGASRETWLFVPTKLSGPADWNPRPTPGADSAASLGIEHASPWEEFVPWIERRLASNPSPVLYVDDTNDWWGKRGLGRLIPESNPPGLDPIVDAQLLWRLALERRWPKAKLKSASDVIEEMRSVKSPAEIERMRAVGKATVGAWLRGSMAVGNGDNPSQVKAELVRGCIDNGAQSPSFWPVVRNSLGGKLLSLDMGCDLDHYQTDTCRMVPASGHFSPEQKEAWEFYVAAYRAGLAAKANYRVSWLVNWRPQYPIRSPPPENGSCIPRGWWMPKLSLRSFARA